MAISAGLLAAWAAVKGFAASAAGKAALFYGKHKVGVATASFAATSILSNSSFETKNKRVTFRPAGTFGKTGVSVPSIQVRDKTMRVPYGQNVSYSQGSKNRAQHYYSSSSKSSKPSRSSKSYYLNRKR